MKNIHILPTDKYSDLVYSTNKYGGYFLSKHYSPMKDMGDSYQNIYITSDEEIKGGEWCFEVYNGDSWATSPKFIDDEGNTWWLRKANATDIAGCPTTKKIILTTDQDLIKDGVQKIDDEFLEWFIKNPSCEFVKTERFYSMSQSSYSGIEYKIITPKEETLEEDLMMEVPMAQYPKILKHEFKVVTTEDIVGKRHERYSERFDNGKSPIGNPNTWGKRLVDETIGEAFDRIYNSIDFTEFDFTSFKLGAKWLQENSCKHNYILTTEQGHRVIKCLKCDNTQPI